MAATPLWRTARSVWQLGPRARWAAGARIAAVGGVAAMLWFTPVPTRLASPALVEFHGSSEVRTGSTGSVRSLEVSGGEVVQAGKTLLQLENTKLVSDRRQHVADLARLRVQLSRAEAETKLRDVEDATKRMQTAESELAELDRQVAALTIAAPRSGVVVEHDLNELQSRWLERGDEVLELADPSDLEVRAWMSPQDVEWLDEAEEMRFEPAVFGAAAIPVRLDRLQPAATLDLPPDGVTARGGGSLPIDTRGREPKLVSPRLLAIFVPTGSTRQTLAGVPGKLVSGLIWHQAGDFAWRWLATLPLLKPSS